MGRARLAAKHVKPQSQTMILNFYPKVKYLWINLGVCGGGTDNYKNGLRFDLRLRDLLVDEFEQIKSGSVRVLMV